MVVRQSVPRSLVLEQFDTVLRLDYGFHLRYMTYTVIIQVCFVAITQFISCFHCLLPAPWQQSLVKDYKHNFR